MHRWINQSDDCLKCEFKAPENICIHNGVIRRIFTKSKFRKISCKLKNKYKETYTSSGKYVSCINISLLIFETDEIIFNVLQFKYHKNKNIIKVINRFRYVDFFISTEFMKYTYDEIK